MMPNYTSAAKRPSAGDGNATINSAGRVAPQKSRRKAEPKETKQQQQFSPLASKFSYTMKVHSFNPTDNIAERKRSPNSRASPTNNSTSTSSSNGNSNSRNSSNSGSATGSSGNDNRAEVTTASSNGSIQTLPTNGSGTDKALGRHPQKLPTQNSSVGVSTTNDKENAKTSRASITNTSPMKNSSAKASRIVGSEIKDISNHLRNTTAKSSNKDAIQMETDSVPTLKYETSKPQGQTGPLLSSDADANFQILSDEADATSEECRKSQDSNQNEGEAQTNWHDMYYSMSVEEWEAAGKKLAQSLVSFVDRSIKMRRKMMTGYEKLNDMPRNHIKKLEIYNDDLGRVRKSVQNKGKELLGLFSPKKNGEGI